MKKVVVRNAGGPVVAIRNASGEMVGILRLADDEPASGPLDELQRSLDDDMSGRSSWSPYVDHDRAKRAVERLKKYGKLFVSWATAEEVRAFDSLDS